MQQQVQQHQGEMQGAAGAAGVYAGEVALGEADAAQFAGHLRQLQQGVQEQEELQPDKLAALVQLCAGGGA